MSSPLWGVTQYGFKAKRLGDVKKELENNFTAEFGDINLAPQSVTGQIIGVLSKVIADIWENLESVYFSQYAGSASGISLDNVSMLTGITRLPAEQTFVVGLAEGIEGTYIPAGSLAKTPSNGEIFYSANDEFITQSRLAKAKITVLSSIADKYTIVINGVSYIFSIPLMIFVGLFTSSSVIKVTINNITMDDVLWDTDHLTTLENIAEDILAFYPLDVQSYEIIGTDTIKLTPVLGSQIIIDDVTITGSIPQPTYTEGFALPTDSLQVANYLAKRVITSGIVTEDTDGSSFTLTTVDPSLSFNLIIGNYLQVDEIFSPVPFFSQKYGPIPAPVGSLTEMVTSIAGWESINNLFPGTIGRYEETDEELRIRRSKSLKVVGGATVEAIRSRLLQEVPGVTSVTIVENVEMVTDGAGRPPKSFETIIQGGTDVDVANKIWQVKPAGIKTYGSETVPITDSMGNPHNIHFTRPGSVYIWVKVVLTLNPPGAFPADGFSKVAQAILAYGNTLVIGENVYLDRVQAQVFAVPGISKAVVTLAETSTPTASPTYGTADILIDQAEKAVFDISRIPVSL
jgi:uncharacterized phage protein gp47/JayE